MCGPRPPSHCSKPVERMSRATGFFLLVLDDAVLSSGPSCATEYVEPVERVESDDAPRTEGQSSSQRPPLALGGMISHASCLSGEGEGGIYFTVHVCLMSEYSLWNFLELKWPALLLFCLYGSVVSLSPLFYVILCRGSSVWHAARARNIGTQRRAG